jgi:hypothetical protein
MPLPSCDVCRPRILPHRLQILRSYIRYLSHLLAPTHTVHTALNKTPPWGSPLYVHPVHCSFPCLTNSSPSEVKLMINASRLPSNPISFILSTRILICILLYALFMSNNRAAVVFLSSKASRTSDVNFAKLCRHDLLCLNANCVLDIFYYVLVTIPVVC